MYEEYLLCLASKDDIDSWMRLVEIVKDDFPGLEISEYIRTLIKNIERETALCVKCSEEVVGCILFSYHSKCLSCMAVHPDHRRKGIASAMVEKMISMFPKDIDISVTTFREEDIKGIAPRALYKKYGFVEGELVFEFNYPNQKFILRR